MNRRKEVSIENLLNGGQKKKACEEIWRQVVDEDEYKEIDGVNLDITNLVFEGGGAKGIAYCGAVKALHDLGVLNSVTRFAGTSAGSYMAMKLCLGTKIDDVLLGSLTNFEEIVYDSGKLGFFVNVLRKLGWHTGRKLLEYIRNDVREATGDADTTFYQWYVKTKRELCVVVTNVSTGCVEYCHPKTTPYMSIAEAVKTSMSIPIILQPNKTQEGQLLCDGGLLNNYPIKAFDGWYLSMKKEDSFFYKIKNLSKPFDGNINGNTLGLLVFNADETENFQDIYTKRYGDRLIGTRPDTKLSRSRKKRLDAIQKKKQTQIELIEASEVLLEKLGEFDDDGDSEINEEEFKKTFNELLDDDETKKHVNTLFGNNLNLNAMFTSADLDSNKRLSFAECLHMLQNAGVPLRQLLQPSVPEEIVGMTGYLSSLFSALAYQLRAMTEQPEDVRRTIAIYTDYLGTTDFDMSIDDKIYLMKQGWTGVMVYLKEKIKDPCDKKMDMNKNKLPGSNKQKNKQTNDKKQSYLTKQRDKPPNVNNMFSSSTDNSKEDFCNIERT